MLVVNRARGEVCHWDPSTGGEPSAPPTDAFGGEPWATLWAEWGVTYTDGFVGSLALAAMARTPLSGAGNERAVVDGSAPLCLLAFCLSSCLGRPVPYAALGRCLQGLGEHQRTTDALSAWLETAAYLRRNGMNRRFLECVGVRRTDDASPCPDSGPAVCTAWDAGCGAYCRHPAFHPWLMCRYHAAASLREDCLRADYAGLPPTRNAATATGVSRAVFDVLGRMGLDADLRILEHPERLRRGRTAPPPRPPGRHGRVRPPVGAPGPPSHVVLGDVLQRGAHPRNVAAVAVRMVAVPVPHRAAGSGDAVVRR
jgi:hypothetical protein